ncbi:hypothetical protein ACFYY5_29585 [Nocardia elegans]|uniref:Tail assembly chaperone n=1 Tax=Nocardia elegans TaxID=300029 RepID=A0ABW6TQQ4_9NOCA
MATANTRKTSQPAAKKSRYAQLRDQARARHKAIEPYMFDGTEPPTPITAPDTIERTTALAELVDSEGRFDSRRIKALFAVVCGDDAFYAVWSVIKDEPAELLLDLINDINEHFNGVPGDEGDDLPGGA